MDYAEWVLAERESLGAEDFAKREQIDAEWLWLLGGLGGGGAGTAVTAATNNESEGHMRRATALRGRAAIVATTVAAAVCSGLMGAAAVPAAAQDGAPGGLGRWAPFGHGRTLQGPWDDGWRDGAPPPPTLNGDWAPFNRCPVDDPTMLAVDGVQEIALCVAVSSPSGGIKIGALSLPTGESNIQFGLIGENHEETETTFKLISPRGGAPAVAPIVIPNGLPALVCPGTGHELWWICRGHPGRFHDDHGFTDITASVQAAGDLSNFSLSGALSPGVPIASVPVKIHLQNDVLGPQCYIGSDSEPIVLQLESLTPFTSSAFEGFETDGTPATEGGKLIRIELIGATDGDQSFAVPGVNGCGFRGRLDVVIDHNAGLPSPAGANALVMNETSTYLTGISSPGELAPNEGKDLSQYWHSAIQGGPHGHWHH